MKKERGIFMDKQEILKKVNDTLVNVIHFIDDDEESEQELLYIGYRKAEEQEYKEVVMKEEEFCIGRGKGNDLVLESDLLELRHVVISKKTEENRTYFELRNYSKINPVEFFNRRIGKYEFLDYKERVELEDRDVFYIGDIKIRIVFPN